VAKGKGELTTFWVNVPSARSATTMSVGETMTHGLEYEDDDLPKRQMGRLQTLVEHSGEFKHSGECQYDAVLDV
jgi:hypothetical protein